MADSLQQVAGAVKRVAVYLTERSVSLYYLDTHRRS